MTIVGDRIDEGGTNCIERILRERFRHIHMDFGHIHYSLVADQPAITCHIYLPSESWQNFFSQLWQIRSYFEELQRQVRQIIISRSERDYPRTQRNYPERNYPSFQLLHNYQGIWISYNMREYISHFLKEANVRSLEDWFFFPFDTDETDGDYELCTPSQLREVGNRINGSVRRMSVPVGLRVRLAQGHRLSDYMSATFNKTLQSVSSNQDSESALTLGGLNVILTTILQMNDKLPLVNYYSEKLTDTEDINLYSLSAMNLSLVDDRDETDIAVLVSSGQIIIEDIKLGHRIGE
ncbi:hypothetical protein [Microcystis aeruginosa]|uniref:Uncharacterized protein n=1 Tax=Microcystis aeruginosa NIES-4285 TaxID=2497681 RepID=A0A402DHK2_MICAE|nr:hypothetical protein [Microcystis aeruginosa]GCE61713.1 hypothetical protein MiAbB_03653 [Microcystis aeruginosa NIES-4285]